MRRRATAVFFSAVVLMLMTIGPAFAEERSRITFYAQPGMRPIWTMEWREAEQEYFGTLADGKRIKGYVNLNDDGESGLVDVNYEPESGTDKWVEWGTLHVEAIHGRLLEGRFSPGPGLGPNYDAVVDVDSTYTGPPWSPTLDVEHTPVIFIPGIAGSRLVLENPVNDQDVWPLAPVADRAVLALEYDGKTPQQSDVVIKPEGVVSDVAAVVPVYRPLLTALVEHGYGLNKDLFLFPYDFRLDNSVHVLELDKVVRDVQTRTGSDKVDIVAHSMGGLIARAYVNSIGKDKVGKLVTMASPFYGSPKAYYAVVGGYTFGNDTVRPQKMKSIAQNWPSAYQLFPRKEFMIEGDGGWRVPLENSYALNFKGFKKVVPQTLGPDIYFESDTNDWSLNGALLDKATDFHAMLVDRQTGADRPLPSGVQHYAIIGHGVSSLWGYTVRSVLPSAHPASYVELGDRKIQLKPRMGDGDGTVPLWGLDIQAVTAKYFVRHRNAEYSGEHTPVTANPGAQAIAILALDDRAPDPRHYPLGSTVQGSAEATLWVGERVDFELHSDAHLTVEEDFGYRARLGYGEGGQVNFEGMRGSFVENESGEYVSIAEPAESYKVTVRGIRTGSFHLDVAVSHEGTTTRFQYPETTVESGTVATVVVYPDGASHSQTLYDLEVVTGGTTTRVPAGLVEVVASPQPPKAPAQEETSTPTTATTTTPAEKPGRSMLIGAVVLAGLVACGAVVALVLFRRRASGRPEADAASEETPPQASVGVAEPTPGSCPVCGGLSARSENFCVHCGAPMGE